MATEKPCVICGKPFLPYRQKDKYCSHACRLSAWTSKHGRNVCPKCGHVRQVSVPYKPRADIYLAALADLSRAIPQKAFKSRNKALDERGTSLYRMFGRSGDLLYVGVSSNLAARLVQHENEKEWWHEILFVEVEHFPDRLSAEAAENRAIKGEAPVYNRSGRSRATLDTLTIRKKENREEPPK